MNIERALWEVLEARSLECERYANALIEIACDFLPIVDAHWDEREETVGCACAHCGADVEDGCGEACPGLLARRALGVA